LSGLSHMPELPLEVSYVLGKSSQIW
jgi:hypothetical protein